MFLSHYCSETESDNIKVILNALEQITGNVQTKTDSIDWAKYLEQAKINLRHKNYYTRQSRNNSILFTEQEVFDAMVLLLEEKYKIAEARDLGGCLSDLAYYEYGETADPAMADFWQKFLIDVKSSVNS